MSGAVAVIGLGAIGSSIVRELQARGTALAAYDADPATVRLAQRAGVSASLWRDRTNVESDVVILATPVRATIELLRTIGQRRDWRLVMDVGSTKRDVLAAAAQHDLAHCFVGAHPLAGTEQSGWRAGRTGCFSNKTVYLCAAACTEPQSLDAARELWRIMGANIEVTDAESHDTRMAWVSHLPQLASSALALALRTAQLQRSDLGAGGRDMTRLAGSNPAMWLDVAMTNADQLDEPLGCLIEALSDMMQTLRHRDEERMTRLLEAARAWHTQSAGN